LLRTKAIIVLITACTLVLLGCDSRTDSDINATYVQPSVNSAQGIYQTDTLLPGYLSPIRNEPLGNTLISSDGGSVVTIDLGSADLRLFGRVFAKPATAASNSEVSGSFDVYLSEAVPGETIPAGPHATATVTGGELQLNYSLSDPELLESKALIIELDFEEIAGQLSGEGAAFFDDFDGAYGLRTDLPQIELYAVSPEPEFVIGGWRAEGDVTAEVELTDLLIDASGFFTAKLEGPVQNYCASDADPTIPEPFTVTGKALFVDLVVGVAPTQNAYFLEGDGECPTNTDVTMSFEALGWLSGANDPLVLGTMDQLSFSAVYRMLTPQGTESFATDWQLLFQNTQAIGPLDLWVEYPAATEIDPQTSRTVVSNTALEQFVTNISTFIGGAATQDVVVRMNYPSPGAWNSLDNAGTAVDAGQMFQALINTYPFYEVESPPKAHTLASAIAAAPNVNWWILLSSNDAASWQGADINTPSYQALSANQHAVDGFALNVAVVSHYESLLKQSMPGFSFAGVVFEAEDSGLSKTAAGPGLDSLSNTIAKQLYSVFTTPTTNPIQAIPATPASGQWAATGTYTQANPLNDFTLNGNPVIGHWFPQWYDASDPADLQAYTSGSISDVVNRLDTYKPNFSARVAADKSLYTAMISAENGWLRKYIAGSTGTPATIEVKTTPAKFFGEGYAWSDVQQAATAIQTKHGVRVMVYNLAELPLNQTQKEAEDIQALGLP
tara:strand:+ start:643 stop:2820 length:2178 start_codon:yes stop_codon:yes gene_type:complete